MRQIKFTASGANSVFGGFATGDTARVSDDMARHLVEEARCARYLDAAPAAAVEAAASPRPEKPKRSMGAKLAEALKLGKGDA